MGLALEIIDLCNEAKIAGEFGKFGFLSKDPVDLDNRAIEDLTVELNGKILDADKKILDVLDKLPDARFSAVELDRGKRLVIAWPREAVKNKRLISFYTKIIKELVL